MAKRRTKRNFLGFKKRETYHARIVRPKASSAGSGDARSRKPHRPRAIRFQGVTLYPLKGGEYTTSIDRDSRFDDLKTAKAFIKSWKLNPKNKATPLERQIDKLLDSIYAQQDPLQREMLADKHSAKYKRMSRRYMKDLRKVDALQKQYREQRGISNPAKFDRCIKDVKASLKKARRPGNAYAICTAAGTRNSKKKTRRNYQSVVWSAKQGSSKAEVYKTGPKKFIVEFSNGTRAHARSFPVAQAIARLRLHEIASNPISREVAIVPGANYADTLVRAGQRVAKGVSKSAKGLLKKLGRRKNPVDVAVKRYEEFHGYPVNEINEVESKEHRHSVTYGLARLICLNVIDQNGKQLPPLISPGFKFVGPIRFAYLVFDGDKLLTPKEAADRAGVKEDDAGYWAETTVEPNKIVWLTAGEDNKQLLLDGGDQSLPIKSLGFTERDIHDSMFIGTILRVWYRTRKKFEGDEEVDFYHDFGKEGSKGIYPLLLYRPKNPSLEISGGRYEIAKPERALGGMSPGIVG
jgi:hypothetical protein